MCPESNLDPKELKLLADDVDAVLTAAEQIVSVAKRHNVDTHAAERAIAAVRVAEVRASAMTDGLKIIVTAIASVIATLIGVLSL